MLIPAVGMAAPITILLTAPALIPFSRFGWKPAAAICASSIPMFDLRRDLSVSQLQHGLQYCAATD